jgi:aminopeptidase YwaD
MSFNTLYTILSEHIKGERIREIVGNIANFHRVQASPGYRAAAEYVVDELKQAPIDHIEILQYPADGKTKYYQWEAPIAWNPTSGTLRLVEPETQLLGDYEEMPLYVSTHSQPANITAEVVDVGPGNHPKFYEGKDVKGKIVMATTGARGAHTEAIQHGAIGVIAYPSSERAAGYPEMILYDGIWPDSRTRSLVTFGFSISRRQADQLLAYMQAGKTVKVHATVQAELVDGKMDVVEAVIPSPTGSNKEIFLMAHLCHPKPCANDNASGAGLLVELMRVFAKLKNERAIPEWEYGIRAIWIPEFHGSAAYLHSHEKQIRETTICSINLDMVGESPEKIGLPLYVSNTAYSTPSLLNDVITWCYERVKDDQSVLAPRGSRRPMNMRRGAFSGGSDHVLTTNGIFGIPSVMFGHGDFFHHTTLDTIDMVDSSELKRVGMICGLSILLMASHHPSWTEHVLGTAIQESSKRIHTTGSIRLQQALAGRGIYESATESADQYALSYRQMELLGAMESQAWSSLATTHPSLKPHIDRILPLIIQQVTLYQERLADAYGVDKTTQFVSQTWKTYAERIIKRSYHGLLDGKWMYMDLDEDTKNWFQNEFAPAFGMGNEEFYNLADGSRSLLDILLLLEAEYGFNKIDGLERFLDIWKSLGIISW